MDKTATRLTLPVEPPVRLDQPVINRFSAAFPELPGIANLLSLAERRHRFWGPQLLRLRKKISYLIWSDRASGLFLDRLAHKTRHPNSQKVAKLIWVVHRTHSRLVTWPVGVGRSGPVAALYHFYGPRSSEMRHFAELIHSGRATHICIRPDDGTFQATLKPKIPRILPMAILEGDGGIATQLPPQDKNRLSEFFAALRKGDLLETSRDYENLCRQLKTLILWYRQGLTDFLNRFEAVKDTRNAPSCDYWHQLRRSLYRTAHFVRRWRGRVTWKGSLFNFYFLNDRDQRALSSFHSRIARGNVRAVRFRESVVTYEPIYSVRRTHRMAATTYSYRDADSISFLPNPKNKWGAREFDLKEEEVRRRIQQFFERMEGRLKVTSAHIQRTLQIPYYFIRSGKTGMAAAHLSNAILKRLELSDTQREELRHLQTLYAVIRDLQGGPERGPYWRQGVMIRYYRLLHQIPIRGLRQLLFQTGSAIEGATEVELGRCRLENPDQILAVARFVGVPRVYEKDFVDSLFDGYRRIHNMMAGRTAIAATDFPNPGWSIPYEGVSKEALQSSLQKFGRELRGPLPRKDFERQAGLTLSHVHNLERHAELSPRAWVLYDQFLKRQERLDEARQLRILRAALEMKYNPIPDRGGYFRAGRLLRFVRSMMPGVTVEQLCRTIGLSILPAQYIRWEWGFTVMPLGVRGRFAQFLVQKSVLSEKQSDELLSRLDEIYR